MLHTCISCEVSLRSNKEISSFDYVNFDFYTGPFRNQNYIRPKVFRFYQNQFTQFRS